MKARKKKHFGFQTRARDAGSHFGRARPQVSHPKTYGKNSRTQHRGFGSEKGLHGRGGLKVTGKKIRASKTLERTKEVDNWVCGPVGRAIWAEERPTKGGFKSAARSRKWCKNSWSGQNETITENGDRKQGTHLLTGGGGGNIDKDEKTGCLLIGEEWGLRITVKTPTN